jgi:hypothetical protein
MKSYTINTIQQEMNDSGSHWWDRDTMRSFRCRVGDQVYQGPGGIYFVTSEKGPYDGAKRRYTVRQYMPGRKSVETVGEFCAMTRDQAHRMAGKLAGKSRDEQFTEAMNALDMAVTGKDKSRSESKYGTADNAAYGSVLYLSDGGYTRVIAHQYDTGGFYLRLDATGSKASQEKAKQAWGDAYKLQSEVCRVLETEPAGETAVVSAEVHKPLSAAEQLALDLGRNGGECTEPMAAYLIRLAAAHQKAMEDYCNGTFQAYDAEGEAVPKLANLRKRIEKLAVECGCTGVHFQGDPRGATVKLNFKNGATNDWGKEGWCVPTRD